MTTFPPRCFTCGKVVGTESNIEKYLKGLDKQRETLDSMGLRRSCCRRMFLGYAYDFDEKLSLYDGIRGERAEVIVPKVKKA